LLDDVLPTVGEWESAKLDVRKAIVALSQIDILHRALHHLAFEPDSDGRRAEAGGAVGTEPARGHPPGDRNCAGRSRTREHGLLARKGTRIKLGQRPEEASSGHLLFAPLGAVAIGGSISELAIVLDDGGQVWVPGIVGNCMDFWEKIAARRPPLRPPSSARAEL
jgi:hypothetical protein